jgi:hypothetical protein
MDVRIQQILQMSTDFYLNPLFLSRKYKNPYLSVQSVESVHPFVS